MRVSKTKLSVRMFPLMTMAMLAALPGTVISKETRTNSSGYFVFINVQPGPYALTVEKPGFKVEHVATFDIVVNQTLTQNLRLDVGAVTETVTVSAETPLLQASSSELGTAIEETPLKELP